VDRSIRIVTLCAALRASQDWLSRLDLGRRRVDLGFDNEYSLAFTALISAWLFGEAALDGYVSSVVRAGILVTLAWDFANI